MKLANHAKTFIKRHLCPPFPPLMKGRGGQCTSFPASLQKNTAKANVNNDTHQWLRWKCRRFLCAGRSRIASALRGKGATPPGRRRAPLAATNASSRALRTFGWATRVDAGTRWRCRALLPSSSPRMPVRKCNAWRVRLNAVACVVKATAMLNADLNFRTLGKFAKLKSWIGFSFQHFSEVLPFCFDTAL